MPIVSPEEHANALERERRLINTRFGYEHSLRSILTRFMSADETNLAINAAKNRKLEDFHALTNHIKKDDSQAVDEEAVANEDSNHKPIEQAAPIKIFKIIPFVLGCLTATAILLTGSNFNQTEAQESVKAKTSSYRIPLGIVNPPACEFMTIQAYGDQSSVPLDSFDKPMPTVSAYIECEPTDKTLSGFEVETALAANTKEEQDIAESAYNFFKEELQLLDRYQLIEPCGDDICVTYFPESGAYITSRVDPEDIREFYLKLLTSGLGEIESTIQNHLETKSKWESYKS
ncbi:hypothetical protein LMH73_011675 [Vibrio splendidus]|nr:hypothetical protein [Vibrio splendidus]MCC4883045.1 hypothetical protein [Vibrio splendidus]